jgi:hypothetical protein
MLYYNNLVINIIVLSGLHISMNFHGYVTKEDVTTYSILGQIPFTLFNMLCVEGKIGRNLIRFIVTTIDDTMRT